MPATPQSLREAFAVIESGIPVSHEWIASAAKFAARSIGPDTNTATTATLKASCVYFAQQILTGPMQSPYYGHFLVGPHHKEWDELVRRYSRVCVLASRDHGKTYFFDFAYPLWKAATMPGGKGYIFSATKDQAVRILADIRSEIETNPKLAHLLPTKERTKKAWSQARIQLANGHQIFARGFGTKVRGAHPDWIVVDDALNDETAYSEVVRRKQIEYFFTAITNMVVPNGQIIVVGTPFHQADLYSELAKNTEYVHRRYQALNGPDEVPLWPERYSKEALARKRREIGTVRFTREFQVEPIADDMSLFPKMLFEGSPVEQMSVVLGMPGSFWERAGVTTYIGVDFALSSTAQADYTVIWVMGLDRFGNRWIIDIKRGKGLSYQRQLSMVNAAGRRYKPALIFVEANQAQRIFGDELIRLTDLPIKLFTTTAAKHKLDKGIPSLRVLLENAKFRIPRGDARSVEITDTWIDEMRAITWQDGEVRSVAPHDDTVFACWICDQAIRLGGFSFDFGADTERDKSLDEMLGEMNEETTDEEEVLGEDELAMFTESDRAVREALGMLTDAEAASGAGEPSASLVDEDEIDVLHGLGFGAPSPGSLASLW